MHKVLDGFDYSHLICQNSNLLAENAIEKILYENGLGEIYYRQLKQCPQSTYGNMSS